MSFGLKLRHVDIPLFLMEKGKYNSGNERHLHVKCTFCQYSCIAVYNLLYITTMTNGDFYFSTELLKSSMEKVLKDIEEMLKEIADLLKPKVLTPIIIICTIIKIWLVCLWHHGQHLLHLHSSWRGFLQERLLIIYDLPHCGESREIVLWAAPRFSFGFTTNKAALMMLC